MDLFKPIVHFFQAGGIFMYPIAVLLLLGVAIAIERWRFLARSHRENRELWGRMVPLLNQKDFNGAETLAKDSTSPIGKVMAYALAHSRNSRRHSEVELAMEESLMEVTSLFEKRTHYLAVFANVATLVGLLGTISGLIQAFAAIASLNLAEKTDVLSASISEALNCTAFGLVTAVPLLLIHAWLTTRTSELVDSVEMTSVKFLNSLNLEKAG